MVRGQQHMVATSSEFRQTAMKPYSTDKHVGH